MDMSRCGRSFLEVLTRQVGAGIGDPQDGAIFEVLVNASLSPAVPPPSTRWAFLVAVDGFYT